MHDVLRKRLWRHIEALPEEQLYQALDYIEFLSSKYARTPVTPPSSPLQRFSERWEDKMRGQGLGLRAVRGTLQAMGTADRLLSGVTEAGRSLIREVEQGVRADSANAPVERKDDGAPRPLPKESGDPGSDPAPRA